MNDMTAGGDAAARRHLQFLDDLARATHPLADPTRILQATARMLGEYLDCDRCAYAQVADDEDTFDLVGDYARGVPSIVGRYAFADFGVVVRDLMRAGQPYVNDDVDTDPRTAGTDLAAYRQTRIRAVICVPLHKDGRFVAAMAVHQAVPRTWRPDEIDLVRIVVARCWETLNRARGEQALRHANQRLEFALEAAGIGEFRWKIDDDQTMFNPRGAAVFGVAPDFAGTWATLRERLHPDDRERARLSALRALEERSVYSIEYRVATPAGERWVLAQGRGVYDDDGRPVEMIGLVQDVTARRAAQERERAEAAVLELLNGTAAALAAELDLDVLVQRVTDAATGLTGARFGSFFYNSRDDRGDALVLYTLSGAPKSAFEKLGHPRPTDVFGPTFRGDAPIRSDDITRDPRYGRFGPHHGQPPGHLPVRSYLAVSVVSRSGEVIGGLFFGHPEPGVFDERAERLAVGIAAQAAIAIDNARMYADAQRAAEERRHLLDSERRTRQALEEAGASKDAFLATLSHELRTPLSAILGWTHLLRAKLDPALTDLHKGVDVIERNTKAQTQLIDDLLDMSRIASGKLRLDVQTVAPIGFIEQAIETVRPMADAAGVRIEALLDPAAGPLSGDPARLQQVIWNLLSNAVKFTPRGGKVQVLLERVNSHVEITVADTGIGIAPDMLPVVFDRFRQVDSSTTRRFGGLGLGLAIVRQLVELHGGSVHAKSPGEGQGSSFVIHLPVNIVRPVRGAGDAHPVAAGPSVVPGEDELAGLRVLLVDDEPDAREALALLLASCGADVASAGSALDALDAMRTQPPDVLVSDVGMPDVDGYELLRRVRALPQDAGGGVPAIALTAFARSEDRVRALRAGFAAHVAKPVEPSEIVVTIASLVRRASTG